MFIKGGTVKVEDKFPAQLSKPRVNIMDKKEIEKMNIVIEKARAVVEVACCEGDYDEIIANLVYVIKNLRGALKKLDGK